MITNLQTLFSVFYRNNISRVENRNESAEMLYVFMIGLEKPEKSITVKAPDKATAAEIIRARYPQYNMIWLSQHAIEDALDWKNMMPGKPQSSKELKTEHAVRTPFVFIELLSNLLYPQRQHEAAKPDYTVMEHSFMKKAG